MATTSVDALPELEPSTNTMTEYDTRLHCVITLCLLSRHAEIGYADQHEA